MRSKAPWLQFFVTDSLIQSRLWCARILPGGITAALQEPPAFVGSLSTELGQGGWGEGSRARLERVWAGERLWRALEELRFIWEGASPVPPALPFVQRCQLLLILQHMSVKARAESPGRIC